MRQHPERGPRQPPFQPPFEVGWIEGLSGQSYPHVVDAEGQIVSFGRGGQDSFFGDNLEDARKAIESLSSGRSPEDIDINEGAKKAAELLERGRNPEDIDINDPK